MNNLRAEIAEMFADCQGNYEEALYRVHQWRAVEKRETRKLNHADRRAAHRRHKEAARLLTAQLKLIRAARPQVVIEKPVLPPLRRRNRIAKIKVLAQKFSPRGLLRSRNDASVDGCADGLGHRPRGFSSSRLP